MRIKGIVYLFVFVILLASLGMVLYRFARPTVIIEFEQPFNPTATTVSLNKTRLYPTGNGGTVYRGRGNLFGASIVRVSGAFVQYQEVRVSSQLFSEKRVPVAAASKSAAEVVRDFLGGKEGSETRAFDNNWIVSLPGEDVIGDRRALVLHYDPLLDIWSDRADAILDPDTTVAIPEPVVSYFLELSDD